MRLFGSIACALAILLSSGLAAAQSATIEAAAKATFGDASTASGALAKLGATPGRLLVAERLPDGSYLVEQAFELGGKTGRIAIRMKQTEAGWEPVWQAEPAFGTALGNVLRSAALPDISATKASARPWSEIQRMPAFPVVVTAKRVITPFGAIEQAAASAEAAEAGPTRGRPKVTGPLPTSQELARHTNLWISRALANDPAPAGFDLIVDASISWERFNAALFSVAGIGLYIGEVIATGANDWVGIPFAAPVSTATGGKPPELVLAFYPDAERFGFRVVHNREQIETGEGCEAPMAICGETDDEFENGLKAAVSGNVDRAMFASGPNTPTAAALDFLVATQTALRLKPHRLFIGFISL